MRSIVLSTSFYRESSFPARHQKQLIIFDTLAERSHGGDVLISLFTTVRHVW